MGVPSDTGPTPGDVGIAELLADPQTRMLWLGVPASIDPTLSILICDIVGLLEEDAAKLIEANAYTDAQVALRALTVHTHAIADVIGLQDALDTVAGVPIGTIVLWSGLIADIPVGWALCNGAGGTIDLRDRFVRGGGGVPALFSTGGAVADTAVSTSAGAHNHAATASSTVLTTDQIPSHAHVVTDPGHTHTATGPGNTEELYDPGLSGPITILEAGAPTGIALSTNMTGITVANNVSAGNGHTHNVSLVAAAAHTHSVTVDTLPPYIVLAYIQRVA